MSETTTAVAPAPSTNGQQAAIAKPAANASVGARGIIIEDYNALARFAQMVEASGFAPKGMNVQAIGIAIQMGLEVGLSPMQAIQSTAVINGRPGIYGDAAKALVEASGLLEDYDQWFDLDGARLQTGGGDSRTPNAAELKNDALTCCVMSRRRGRKPMVTTFSIGDARGAGLWGKAGPWSQYPARMMMFRARGFNLRDNFGDVLKGLRTVEELRDAPSDYVDAPTGDAAAALPPSEPKSAVTALADKLRQRQESVAPNNAEPATSMTEDAIQTLMNELLQGVGESGDAETLDSFINNATPDIVNLSRVNRQAMLTVEDAIAAKRAEFAAEPAKETKTGKKKTELFADSQHAK